MKKFTLFLMLLLGIGEASAATTNTTLWEGSKVFTSYADLQFDKALFADVKSGDVIQFTVTAFEESDAKYSFKQKDNSWEELTGFGWIEVSEAKTYEYTITETTATELKTYGLVIQANNITATKVVLVQTTEDPTSTTELWSGTNALGDWANFESLRYDNKGALATAKINDKIQVTFTNASEGWQIYVCDAASYSEFTDGYFSGSPSDEAKTVSFTIADATTLESIQEKGIVVKGKLATLTKIELLTYANSYDAVPVTIGSDGIATFSSTKKLDFSGTGVTPYYVSAVATGTVTLTAATDACTWDYCGYILQGAEGTYDVPVTASGSYPSVPYLKGQTSQGTVYRSVYSDYSGDATGDELTNIKTKYRYILAKHNSEIGFYKLTADHTLAAHKAYLETSNDITPTNNARLTLIFENSEPTAIKNVSERNAEDITFYNLNGMRVQNPTQGLYIVNGKKVLVR